MVDHLLASRVSVLDIGRVELGDLPDAVATTESYRGVLDLGTRLGAHFVTAAAVPSEQQVTDVADLFGRLVQDCDAYQLIPLLVPQPNTSVATLADAAGDRVPVDRHAARRGEDCDHLGDLVLATLRIDPIVEPVLRAASPLTLMPLLPPVTSARRPAN